MNEPKIHLTPDIIDWLRNPASLLSDGIAGVTFEAPIVKDGQEVGRAIFRPVYDLETKEARLELKIQF